MGVRGTSLGPVSSVRLKALAMSFHPGAAEQGQSQSSLSAWSIPSLARKDAGWGSETSPCRLLSLEAWGKLLSLSVPQFPRAENGDDSYLLIGWLRRLNEVTGAKRLEEGLVPSKSPGNCTYRYSHHRCWDREKSRDTRIPQGGVT